MPEINDDLRRLLLQKLKADQQNEPKEENEFLKGDILQERNPVKPEDIEYNRPIKIAQAATPTPTPAPEERFEQDEARKRAFKSIRNAFGRL